MVLFFAMVMAGLLYLHFACAHWEWRRTRGRQDSEIDLTYVRREDYLGRSFRLKIQEWLRWLAAGGKGKGPDRKDNLRLVPSLDLPQDASSGEVLVVEGNMTTQRNATLAREVYVRGNCRIGPASHIQAIAVDGDLVLEADCRVARWVDCRGAIELARGCQIKGRMTAGGPIRLNLGAQASCLWATEIAVPPIHCKPQFTRVYSKWNTLVLPPVELSDPSAPEPARTGFDPRKFKQLSSDTWLYRGDLDLRVPVRLTAKLVVRGSFACAAHSVLQDVKAAGVLVVKESCHCRGNLFARGDIRIGPGTLFQGLIHAGGSVRLCQGVRGSRTGEGVVVYGTEDVVVEENVVVNGKLAAGRQVAAVAERTAPCVALPPQEASIGRPSGAFGLRATTRRLSRGLLLILAVSLPGPLRGQEPPPVVGPTREVQPLRVEIGAYGSQVDRGYGYWRGVNAQIWLRSSPRFIPAFTADSQTRPQGTQQSYSFLSYMNWTSSFYTVQSVSVAPQSGNAAAIYFPRDRFDIKAFWKLRPARRLIPGIGFTRFNFGKPGRGEIYNAGLLYYGRKLVLEGNLFVNRNQPNNLLSASGSVSAQYGREGSYWAGVVVSGGRELYNYVGIAPVDVKLFSYSAQSFYRKWVTRHFGYVISVMYLQKLEAYRQVGASAKIFAEF